MIKCRHCYVFVLDVTRTPSWTSVPAEERSRKRSIRANGGKCSFPFLILAKKELLTMKWRRRSGEIRRCICRRNGVVGGRIDGAQLCRAPGGAHNLVKEQGRYTIVGRARGGDCLAVTRSRSCIMDVLHGGEWRSN